MILHGHHSLHSLFLLLVYCLHIVVSGLALRVLVQIVRCEHSRRSEDEIRYSQFIHSLFVNLQLKK